MTLPLLVSWLLFRKDKPVVSKLSHAFAALSFGSAIVLYGKAVGWIFIVLSLEHFWRAWKYHQEQLNKSSDKVQKKNS